MCRISALVADTLKCITLHRGRCTDGPLGALNCFNFSNEVWPIVALGGTLQEVFSHTALAHSGNDATDYQRIADRFEALDFVDHDLSLACCDGIEEVTFERAKFLPLCWSGQPFCRRESVRDRRLLQHSSTQHLPIHRVEDPTRAQ